MYLELITTATAVQRDLANAYTQSGRMVEVGQYFRTLNLATALFFEQVEPPPTCRDLHDAFLMWQKLGQEALVEELEAGAAVDSAKSQRYIAASERFASAMATFAEQTEATQV